MCNQRLRRLGITSRVLEDDLLSKQRFVVLFFTIWRLGFSSLGEATSWLDGVLWVIFAFFLFVPSHVDLCMPTSHGQ